MTLNEIKKLANKGDANAQFNLGLAYSNGKGATKDYAQAAFWYRKAAEQGDACAQINLGVLYSRGKGVPKNNTQAVFWYRKAAEQGYFLAQCNLGNMYFKGLGVPKDEVEAYAWYKVASVFDDDAKSLLDSLEKTMTPDARTNAHARTQEIQKLIDERKGSKSAQSGSAKVHPTMTPDNIRKLANRGDAKAQFFLGFMYNNSFGVPKDYAQAVFWYLKAAEQGYARAQSNLGNMYSKGYGVPKDDAQAAFWYRKAAEQGYARAQLNLGFMYSRGYGVPKDEIEAYAWYNIASVADNDAKVLRDSLEKTMTPEARIRAQARTRELQKLIEERKAGGGKVRVRNSPGKAPGVPQEAP